MSSILKTSRTTFLIYIAMSLIDKLISDSFFQVICQQTMLKMDASSNQSSLRKIERKYLQNLSTLLQKCKKNSKCSIAKLKMSFYKSSKYGYKISSEKPMKTWL